MISFENVSLWCCLIVRPGGRGSAVIYPECNMLGLEPRGTAEGIHRYPVIDDGNLIGVISSLDLVRVMGRVGLAED